MCAHFSNKSKQAQCHTKATHYANLFPNLPSRSIDFMSHNAVSKRCWWIVCGVKVSAKPSKYFPSFEHLEALSINSHQIRSIQFYVILTIAKICQNRSLLPPKWNVFNGVCLRAREVLLFDLFVARSKSKIVWNVKCVPNMKFFLFELQMLLGKCACVLQLC